MQIPYSIIETYWNKNPCAGGNERFPFQLFKGKKVLEIGCGLGVDASNFVYHGANYTGIDLTDTAVAITQLKLSCQYINSQIYKMNAEFLDFPDDYFDLVYSWGVIHHAVNPRNIINEAYRVLKPDGRLCIMLYNKPSWRYNFDIMFFRKLLWIFRYHKYDGIRIAMPHPTKEQWISMNTDTLGCPLARVYTKTEAVNLLVKFKAINTFTRNKNWFRILMAKK